MVDPIQRPSSSPFSPEDYDKPVPTTKERARPLGLDRTLWLSDPAFGSVVHYSAAMLANPALRAGPEEALAETYAQVKVNGVRALPDGLAFPIRNGYVNFGRVAGEGAIGTIAYGGVLCAVHVRLNQK